MTMAMITSAPTSMIKVYYSNVASISAAKIDELIPALPRWRQEAVTNIRLDNDRKLSIAAGTLLMLALEDSGISSDSVILKNSHGKPYLRDYPDVHFSLSHSGDYAMCAISDSPIGCDIQKISDTRPQVARRFFTQAEQLYLQGSEDPQVEFTRIWTRKESYVKMKGLGISACPLTSFDVISDSSLPDAIFYELDLPDHHATVCCTVPGEISWEQYDF